MKDNTDLVQYYSAWRIKYSATGYVLVLIVIVTFIRKNMVLESGVLPPPLQLYAAAAAHLAPRPPWAPLLQFPGAAASLLGMPGAFGPLGRPRYPGGGGMGPVMRAPTGPPSEDSGSETHHGKGKASNSEEQRICL